LASRSFAGSEFFVITPHKLFEFGWHRIAIDRHECLAGTAPEQFIGHAALQFGQRFRHTLADDVPIRRRTVPLHFFANVFGLLANSRRFRAKVRIGNHFFNIAEAIRPIEEILAGDRRRGRNVSLFVGALFVKTIINFGALVAWIQEFVESRAAADWTIIATLTPTRTAAAIVRLGTSAALATFALLPALGIFARFASIRRVLVGLLVRVLRIAFATLVIARFICVTFAPLSAIALPTTLTLASTAFRLAFAVLLLV
jgi:hypothetical protein